MSKWETVYIAEGRLAAEIIKLKLESEGIEALLFQESAGATFGLTVGNLGEVEIRVKEEDVELALSLIE